MIKFGKSIKSVIFIGKGAKGSELSAAKELQKYIHKITGVLIPVKSEESMKKIRFESAFLIGTPFTSEALKELVENRLILTPKDDEGFVIKSLRLNRLDVIVIVGLTGIAVKYAVYKFLEKFCDVGFFRDGERHPSLEVLEFEEIDYSDHPKFKYRGYLAHTWIGETRYRSTGLWLFDDWKRLLDWMSKKGFNLFFPILTYNEIYVRQFLRRAFPDVDPSEAARKAHPLPDELRLKSLRKAIEYARKAGFKIAYWAFPRHPSGVEVYEEEALKRFIGALVDLYGKPDFFIASPWCEFPSPGGVSRWDAEKKIYRTIKLISPGSDLIVMTWDWFIPFWRSLSTGSTGFFGRLRFPFDKIFAEWEAHKKMPDDVIIADWDRNFFIPTNGFEGRRWWYQTHISFEWFDLPFTWFPPTMYPVNYAYEKKAEGIIIFNIAEFSNVLLCDYMAELSWNPKLKFERFLEYYTKRRYSRGSWRAMIECYKLLEKASRDIFVYGLASWVDPLSNLEKVLEEDLERCVSLCEESLSKALEVYDLERDNELYRSDLLELKLIVYKLKAMLHLKRAMKTRYKNTRLFNKHLSECIGWLKKVLRELEGDARFSVSSTREWIKQVSGADISVYDEASKVHKGFITCPENLRELIGRIENLRRLEGKDKPK